MPDPVYRSTAIANYLIGASPHGLDALQVMKLAYIAHGFTLGLRGRPLLEDDVEAWKLGPVMRRIYHVLPGGSGHIREALTFERAELTREDKELVDTVLERYGKYTGLYLSSLTHSVGSPWEKTWSTYGKNAIIPQDLIRSHYERIVSDARKAVGSNRPYHPTAL